MSASAAAPSRYWRSNLRRLQRLTAWRRQGAATSGSDAKSCEASQLSAGERKRKCKRCPSAGVGRGKAGAGPSTRHAAPWPRKRAAGGKARAGGPTARYAAPSRRKRAARGKASAPEKALKPERKTKQVSAQEAARPAAAAEESERPERKAKKQAPAPDAAEHSAAADLVEEAERRERRKKEKKEKKQAAAVEATAPVAGGEQQEEEEEEERPKKKAKKKVAAVDASPEPRAAVEEEEASAPTPPKPERVSVLRSRLSTEGCSTFALALTIEDLKKRAGAKKTAPTPPTPPLPQSIPSEGSRSKLEPQPPATPPPENAAPPRAKADPSVEIPRILNAQSPEELLGVDPSSGEEAVTKAWKRLVLLLHPDKLHGLDDATRQAGQDALNFVHMAREELKRRTQEQCAEVPADPEVAGPPRLLEATSGARKYEISWRIPETQDPSRPVEKYEIWGPRYFSEAGDPFDPVLLASLPPLQSHFVLVEEAPTQQDVMWAADRVLRPSLPLTVHAANGKGSSGPLTFELPWASVFPWLQGTSSVLCPQCLRLNARRQHWTRCGGCGYNVPPEASIIVRCPECHGEALWNRANELNCSCCLLRLGQAHDQQPYQQQPWKQQKPPRGHVPPPNFAGSARGGRHY